MNAIEPAYATASLKVFTMTKHIEPIEATAASRYFVRRDVVDHDVVRFRVIDGQTDEVMSGWWDYDRAVFEADIMNRLPRTFICPTCRGDLSTCGHRALLWPNWMDMVSEHRSQLDAGFVASEADKP